VRYKINTHLEIKKGLWNWRQSERMLQAPFKETTGALDTFV
jgi:hypothetical protein